MNSEIYIKTRKARNSDACDVCGGKTAEMTRLVHDATRVTPKGVINTNWRLVVCDECRAAGTAVKRVPHLKRGGITATEGAPVISWVTLNARADDFWAARLLLMAAGFKPCRGTAQRYEIGAAFSGVNRWLKAHAATFPIGQVGYTDLLTGEEFAGSRDRNALDGWLTKIQKIHGSDPVTGIISKPTNK